MGYRRVVVFVDELRQCGDDLYGEREEGRGRREMRDVGELNVNQGFAG